MSILHNPQNRLVLQIAVPMFPSSMGLKMALLHLTILTCKMGIILDHFTPAIFLRGQKRKKKAKKYRNRDDDQSLEFVAEKLFYMTLPCILLPQYTT